MVPLDALDECLSSGVLRAETDGVLFRHQLARLAVEGWLAPDRAVTLHRRALGALADSELGAPDYVRLAHHAEAAGDGPAVLRYVPAAGERAAEARSRRGQDLHRRARAREGSLTRQRTSAAGRPQPGLRHSRTAAAPPRMCRCLRDP